MVERSSILTEKRIRLLEILVMFGFILSFLWMGLQFVELHQDRQDAWKNCSFEGGDPGLYNFTLNNSSDGIGKNFSLNPDQSFNRTTIQ